MTDWRDRIKAAKKWVEQNQRNWQENIKLYNGRQKYRKQKKYEAYVNLLYMSYKTDKSQCVPSSLDFYAQVSGRNDVEMSSMVSALLNNQLATSENVMKTGKWHTQAVCKGTGVACVNVRRKTTTAYKVEAGDEELDYETGMDNVEVNFLKTEDVLYDKDACDYATIKWVAGAYDITVDEFKQRDDFQNKDKVIKANGIGEDTPIPSPTGKGAGNMAGINTNLTRLNQDVEYKDPRFGRIRIWEIWDTIDRQIVHLEDVSGLVVKEESYEDVGVKNPNFDHPYEFLSFTEEDDEQLPPVAELDLVKDYNELLNALMSSLVRDAKRGVRHFAAFKSMVDVNEMQKLLNADKRSVILVDDKMLSPEQQKDIRNIITPMAEDPSVPDVQNTILNIMNFMQQTIGYGSAERGGLPQTSTATEANLVATYLSGRSRMKLVKVLDFWKRIAYKSLMLMADMFDDEHMVKMFEWATGPTWKKLKMEEIRDVEFHIEVYAGSKGIIDRQTKMQEQFQMIKELAPLAQQMGWDLTPLVEKLLATAEWKPSEISGLMSDRKEKMKALAQAFMQAMEGGMDEMEAMRVWGLLAEVLKANLSPVEIAELQGKFKQSGGKAQGSQQVPGMGSQRQSEMGSDMNSGYAGG